MTEGFPCLTVGDGFVRYLPCLFAVVFDRACAGRGLRTENHDEPSASEHDEAAEALSVNPFGINNPKHLRRSIQFELSMRKQTQFFA